MEDKKDFHFTYSAAQWQEIENIRKNYIPRQEDKMELLRALHRSAGQRAQAWAITLGVIGALTLGTGMSLVMTDLAQLLGQYQNFAILIGITTGFVGLVLTALAYPLYNKILKKERARIAPQILQLTDELLK